MKEMLSGAVSGHVRDIQLEDLLGREPAVLQKDKISRYLKGKRVLITGAGGSIGSELCRQASQFGPACLVLFDNAETPLFNVEQEISKHFPDIPLRAIIGDVRDRDRVNSVFDEVLPEVVFHAAAYKHVPMMEHNPAEAVNNNIYGSKVLADAADAFGVQHFVMVSTDKAVNPTNVMGATKRTAEMYVQSLAKSSKTHFVTVRFGNVLGSNGSVIPTFKEQIANGGPVTVTDPEITRFFMTIPEASQLVLQAGSMGRGGEIFLLDMGEPVKIVKLAEDLIRLSGLKPHEDIKIEYTGLRPGEKLYEELLLAGEDVSATTHEMICVAKSERFDREVLTQQLETLFASAKAMELRKVVLLLQQIVPEFKPAFQGHRMLTPTNDSSRGKVVPLVRQSEEG
jgi:FlaA1/EpsC-like NDP-sugar epimerase